MTSLTKCWQTKQKVISDRVNFLQADINAAWSFGNQVYDLVTFSLVLEHIENLEHIFKEASLALKPGGIVYLGELHPFKQYTGTKARFDTEAGRHAVECFNHHISDFTTAAKANNLKLENLNEYFDENDRSDIPRILTLLFIKI